MRRVFFSAAVILVWMLTLPPVAHATAMMATYDSVSGSCTTPSTGPEYRTYDGTCNNMRQGTWGSAGSQLIRLGEASYADGISTPAGTNRPNTREVSNTVVAQSGSIPNAKGVSDMLMQWGQFIDHDIDLTPTHDLTLSPNESLPISIPTYSDRFWPIYGSDGMPFSRSQFDSATGTSGNDPRQQINAITAYIDASQIYGSSKEIADSLRVKNAGGTLSWELKMSAGALLHKEDGKFVSGDERAREQVGLTAMHTLFNREHNRLAKKIADENPGYSDEKVYQEARKLVGAMMQSITFNEFLPALLGGGQPGAYGGYDYTVNPGIANEFSTAAYRFGHSTLSDTMLRLGADGQPINDGGLALADAFFNPEHLLTAQFGGIEAVLRGLASQRGQEVDPFLVDGVRNLLFGPPVDMGFDLAALNMQRGRDHGLPSYTEMRFMMFGDMVDDWDDLRGIMMDGAVDLLKAVYQNDFTEIDLWIGGLAENHVNGGMLGQLFSAIISEQFGRLRDGDRFWYQNDMFEPTWMESVENSTLSVIMARNGISGMRANVFYVPTPGILALLTVGFLSLQLRIRSGSRPCS